MMRAGSMRMMRALLATTLLAGAGAAVAQDAPPVDEAPVATEEVPADLEVSQDRAADAPRLQQAAAGIGTRGGTGFALDPDGNSRLHLRLDVGAGLDTNPYAIPLESTTGFTGDIVTRIRPGLDIEYPGSLIAFDGAAYLDYGFLPDVFNVGNAQRPNWLLYQSALRGALEVNRGGMFSFAGANNFSLNTDPGIVALGSVFTRLHNDLSLGVGYRPGGGTLRFRLAYTFGFEKWFDPNFGLFGGQSADAIRAGAFDQMNHMAQLRVDYRFLPKTGLFASLSGGWHTYPFDRLDVNPDSFPVGINVGLMGQMTPKLSGLVSLGYQNPLVVDETGIATATVIGAVGQAELRWAVTPTTRLAGGIQRNFRPAPLYQFLTNNRVYARFDQAIGAKFVLSTFAGYSLLQFGEEQDVGGVDLTNTTGLDRLDGHLNVRANLSYFMLDWLSFGIANNLDWRMTNAEEPGSGTNFSYFANETLVLASVHY